MGLFRREAPLFGTPSSESGITVQAGDYVENGKTEAEVTGEDQQWEADVAELEGMTASELFRDAAESIVDGDDWEEGSPEALEHYTRASAVAQLAMVRVFQESGQAFPKPE